MLEKFCIGLVRILLGGILFFLTLLSAVVTCRVYGGSEIVQYGRDSLFLHLFFGAGVIGLTVFYRRRKERKCRKNQWLLLAAAAYLFWILLVPSWGGSDSHQCMASAAGTSQGDFSAGAGGVFIWDSGRTAWVCVHLSVSERADSLYGSAGIFLWRCGVCSFPDFKYWIFYSGNREPAEDDGPGKRKVQLAFVDGVLSAIFFLYPLRVRHDAQDLDFRVWRWNVWCGMWKRGGEETSGLARQQ